MRTKKPKRAAKAPTETPTRADAYQDVTDRILAALESGEVAPWQRPWKTSALGSFPKNAISGKEYRGINVFLLAMTACDRGYDLPLWMTFAQANEIAGRAQRKLGRKVEQNDRGSWVFADGDDAGQSCGGIRKGQNREANAGATGIIFWKPMEARKGADGSEGKAWMLCRLYQVFNAAQCDDATLAYLTPASGGAAAPTFNPIERAEQICAAYSVPVSHGGNRAYYHPREDRIQLPERTSFHSAEHYYTTRFHEIGHSTGHQSRLDRDGITKIDFFGSHQYAEEELVAEFAACFLAGEAGILRTVEDNGVSYLKNWAAKIREDKTLIMRAAQRAQKAADLVLGRNMEVSQAVAA